MDITKLGKIWASAQREIATAARLYPPQVLRVPLSFPFRISPATTTVVGRNLRQQALPATVTVAKAGAVDARHLREQFQELPHSDVGLVRFLNRYGWWDERYTLPIEEVWEFQEWLNLILCGSRKLRGKQLSSRGLFGRLPGLLARPFSFSFEWNEGLPLFIVETSCCLDAIRATVLLDVVLGIRYTKCKRRDCHMTFPHKRGKVFHSAKCQHLELVRRSRR